jgi:hypothetical protein
MTNRPIITLLTDFGTQDAYVGSMKGVILGINPEAILVDLSHEVDPQDVVAGAFLLSEAAPYFPPGTIHLAVVDPEVGTGRLGLAVRAHDQFWVGPDNGLLYPSVNGATNLEMVSLENPVYFRPDISATFHGRDLFAPVAAHLSRGVPLAAFGPPLKALQVLTVPQPLFTADSLEGEIISVDRFGNLVSNLPAQEVEKWLKGRNLILKAGPLTLNRLSRTYADASPGAPLVLTGSHGFLEIAVNQGSAADRLGQARGLPVVVVRG